MSPDVSTSDLAPVGHEDAAIRSTPGALFDLAVPPPVASMRAHVRELHGESVDDPWAWMADHDDPVLLANLDAERAYYERAMGPLLTERVRIATALRARLPEQTEDCPWDEGGWTYQRRYPAGAQYPLVVRWRPSPPTNAVDAPPPTVPAAEQSAHVADQTLPSAAQTVLDLQRIAGDAAYAELGQFTVSDDGTLLAYSVDLTGNEVYELRFRNLATGEDLPDRIERSYYGGAWTMDGSAFYYTVHDDAYRPHEVWRHRIGTSTADDQLILTEQDRRFELDLHRSRSGDWILVSATSRSTRQEWAIDARAADPRPQHVRPRVAGVEDTVEHQRTDRGGRWLVVTNEHAPEFSLVTADVANWASGQADWCELASGRDGQRLDSCDAFAGHLVLGWRSDARLVVEVYGELDGPLGEPLRIASEELAETVRLGRNHEYDAGALVVESTSLVQPPVWSRVPFDGGARRVVHATAAPGHDPGRYVTERRTLPARDGTPVPLTLAYAAGTPLDGSAPALIWAYGAYESCDWPEFDPVVPEWLDRGFVYVQAHVRGGGEGGRAWWEQGHLEAKRNTFTDLIDVADGLAAAGVVDGARIATRGLSAGGLLQGAVATMRPDRWRAVVAEVPFVDCINSMLDESIPLTVNEWEEWGDPREPAAYAWMKAYAPYENVPVQPLPAMLVTGSLHDPRVLVHEPAKWVAKLRALAPSGMPLLFRAETGAGAHAGPSGRYAAMEYEAEVMAFVLGAMGLHG